MKTERKGQWLHIAIPSDWIGLQVEHILRHILHIPKPLLHELRMSKGVKVNNDIQSWVTALAKGDTIQIQLFIDEEYGVVPEYKDISILYEDDHILIVNKPAGMDTHPTTVGQVGTLANAVAFHYQVQGVQTKVRHVHRLDRDTTGAILFAKERLSSALLDHLLEKREIKRTYYALVHGIIKQKTGKIDEPIGRDRHHPTRRRVSQTGQQARTKYKVVTKLIDEQMTLIELELDTGRTHQIRVHMSHLGYPLVGDVLYGGKPIFYRQALHAKRLRLVHPITEELLQIEAPYLDIPAIFPDNS
ncbi:RluA family pseudouridine synthase [Litchfieldia salsa]|uniref:Pseudouridine synthase n=1 Tax=Litchfieldia salsa TaxID=930152 RepID=A0A1H0WSJ4_9BACI|nr:RluA family pseudouridine synthase [Litchfieldia salsa]SDP93619.1 23S rRNA pseudouridine1911/1915/1917 synthase [Litchfieldia salsa]